jgi:hypothetical protein
MTGYANLRGSIRSGPGSNFTEAKLTTPSFLYLMLACLFQMHFTGTLFSINFYYPNPVRVEVEKSP